MKRTVFITGATGVMGMATLKELERRLDRFELRLLARAGKKNRKLLAPFAARPEITVVWGDLLNPGDVEEALGDATVVLHMGGLVSPMADRFPEKTLEVNVEGTRNVVDAIKKRDDADDVRMVYIGSVAQISDRSAPLHWARTGDPVTASVFDYYGLSKILAERVVAESGLRRWVSLRQSGILHPGLFLRGTDPITFHVPLRGVLEWATVEDSGRLMAGLCEEDVPEEIWRGFFNIGSGESYRLTNYEFERLILKAVGSPRPEKVFEVDWFATRNFHGCWFADSDRLEKLVPFREGMPVEEYFRRMVAKAPWWTRLAPLAPAPLVKMMMKRVALTPDLGTLDWVGREDCEDKINAFFGSRLKRDLLPSWDEIDLSPPSHTPVLLDHGYDEEKPLEELDIEDMKRAASFRGGRCLSSEMAKGDLLRPLQWECARGHRFVATPNLVLKGGHWCKECLPPTWRYDEEARLNPFLAQVWRASHSPEEEREYKGRL